MTTIVEQRLAAAKRADRIAAALTEPGAIAVRVDAAPQSLGAGQLGIALLHLERTRTSSGDPGTCRNWLATAIRPHVNGAADTNLYNGAPALAFILHTSTQPDQHATTRARLHHTVKTIIAKRLEAAEERIKQQRPASFAEYSQLSGLTGLGVYLLGTEPGHELTEQVLRYLVELTKPIRIDRTRLPGWWVAHDPYLKDSQEFPGGHANLGAAHGIAGPLACLAIAHRAGITVPGQLEAIERIYAHYDIWQHEDGWWPQWLTRPELAQHSSSQPAPGRPSWCYGTPGIARCLQLAAVALADPDRQRAAEEALLRCLTDQTQQASLVDAGLCHGIAGLYRIVQRAAADAQDPRLGEALPGLLHRLLECRAVENGFLDGSAGAGLALQAAGPQVADGSIWDAALLLTAPARSI
ncbi:lanthionine synthetase C family protein [Glycomyces tenuis]|uniref:lanthionine synthetase C family protein n=1 Tax=Glycomyces tenuis TaxID=58116 RepID=UPI00040DB0BE|nr:lanthionine synthetase C family protein [Glycomyces tenuis]